MAVSAKLKRVGIGLGSLAALAGIAGYAYYDHVGRYFQETNDATIQADQVAIASKLPGYVRSVAVGDNQQVAAGAPLVEIDPTTFRIGLAGAESRVVTAGAAERAARAARAEAEAGVVQARAGLQAALATQVWSQREAARYRSLAAEGIAPAEKLSEVTLSAEKASAAVAAARGALVQAERRLDTLAAEIGRAEAQAGAARVEREAAAHDLASTRLTAPIAGRVASRAVRVGQYVQPGMRLLTLVPTQDLHVVANFKETQVGLMRPGQPATIRVDALPDVTFRGTVVSITPGTGANFSLIPPQNATGNFTKIVQRVPVKIRIEAGPAARQVLVPGLSLVAEVDTRSGRDALEAIRAEQDRPRR